MQKTIDFKGVTFAKLTRGERSQLNKDRIAERRQKLIANLKAAGIEKGEEFFNELEAFDDAPMGLSCFIRWINNFDGEGWGAVQLLALRKVKPDATEEDLPDMTDDESLKLAVDLSGLVMNESPPKDDDADDSKRPSEPDAYTTT